MNRLQGKVAIITGAARGQGEATARLFAQEGATVIMTDVLAEGEDVAANIGSAARFVTMDVRDEDAWTRLVAQVEAEHGRIDALVNNAAVVEAAPMEELTLASFERMLGINLIGTWLGTRAVAPIMRRQGRGAIVNVSSTSGLRGNANMTTYDASKWGVRGMSKAMAMELAPHNVRVNTVHPGAIDTPMLNPSQRETSEIAAELGLPMARVGQPLEVANASLFLVSDDASYVSGAELAVDGAWTAGFFPVRVGDQSFD
ncbi:glucose 1-dehydrogenase [Novosphingobium sp. KCTC 2891]|uniref:SDR family NAD(P)-dependent oxidoreductase n=1 Tax=Novosphingobium sp. KCTC 2891 TaxID=2989730 RepID=UPI0022233973|nr:glucose 1-dehydrogenase [Novosphingobium sp. KCTC 2891]MCW1383804.1 glucose 1-dehydrogenase [Novosphingobium sp. KCTC 2891]